MPLEALHDLHKRYMQLLAENTRALQSEAGLRADLEASLAALLREREPGGAGSGGAVLTQALAQQLQARASGGGGGAAAAAAAPSP